MYAILYTQEKKETETTHIARMHAGYARRSIRIPAQFQVGTAVAGWDEK